MKKLQVKTMALMAILGSLGAVLMFLDFPVFFAPSFYKIDLGDLPCLIGGFALGPWEVLCIECIKIAIKLLLKPTSTAFVGESSAFLFSSVYCVSASYLYQRRKTKKNAFFSLLISSILFVLVSALSNYFFVLDAYVSLYHIPFDSIIDMGKALVPIVHDRASFVLYCVVPFNILKVLIIDILTLLLYKRVSIYLR